MQRWQSNAQNRLVLLVVRPVHHNPGLTVTSVAVGALYRGMLERAL